MTTKQTNNELWFRAKTYGWGWGSPLAWQGWVVYALYAGLVTFGIVNRNADILPIPYGPFLIVITAAVVAICWLKGEKLRWRWGKH